MIKTDEFPTHEINGMKCARGRVMPFGAEIVDDTTVNFSIYSKYATGCELLLYHTGEEKPFYVFCFTDEFRIGSVYSVMIFDLNWEEMEYGYRFDGPYCPSEGLLFNRNKVVLDPYAKLVSGREKWNEDSYANSDFQFRGKIIRDDYDWEGDRPLDTPMKDLVIYEMHVRSFTYDPSSKVKYKGTFAGVVEKIPYLKKLGINCIEFLPIFEFDEKIESDRDDIANFWGYMPVNYFSPKSSYARTSSMGMAPDELKNMIKQLHKNGISVILDIVFNHTAEMGDPNKYISFRGVDNKTYYILKEDGSCADYTGCGNTMNCNNSIVRNFILDSLRYWVSSYHIDGFRVDEAPIFSRDVNGKPMVSPPLVDSLLNDPVLCKTKFISEGWDAGGHNTIGKFPYGWADWNPRTRDTVKRFVKGCAEDGPALLTTLEGSPDMFRSSSPAASLNYVNCHDGFTLYDSVAYNQAHNERNIMPTRMDKFNNQSWNCGAEGETDDPGVNELRVRQMKNLISILLMSRGVPMFYAGDEFANTQYGNNNAYCQDSDVSWLDWNRLEKYEGLFNYFAKMIEFRKQHPVLRKDDFYTGNNTSGYPELSYHGEKAWSFDRSAPFQCVGVLYAEPAAEFGTEKDSFIYFAVNTHWEEHTFELPILPTGMEWRIVSYSADPENQWEGNVCIGNVHLASRSTMVLLGTMD